MNFEYVDNVYRSRMTLLDILGDRGYNVEPYRKFSPAEISVAVEAFPSLSFTVAKKDDPNKTCEVRYAKVSRLKLESFFDDIDDEDIPNKEIIVMIIEPLNDYHHVIALKNYVKRKLRVSFFSMYMIVVNPMKHVLVPKHEIVPLEEHKDLMTRLNATTKSKFPEIKFHIDPIARCIGAVPGDIVKITRFSPSAGESIIYRVCAP